MTIHAFFADLHVKVDVSVRIANFLNDFNEIIGSHLLLFCIGLGSFCSNAKLRLAKLILHCQMHDREAAMLRKPFLGVSSLDLGRFTLVHRPFFFLSGL